MPVAADSRSASIPLTMNRRAFVTGLGAALTAPLVAGAQQAGKIPRIGVLVSGLPPGEHPCVLAFRRGLTDLGYMEGRTHVLEVRWAAGRRALLRDSCSRTRKSQPTTIIGTRTLA